MFKIIICFRFFLPFKINDTTSCMFISTDDLLCRLRFVPGKIDEYTEAQLMSSVVNVFPSPDDVTIHS